MSTAGWKYLSTQIIFILYGLKREPIISEEGQETAAVVQQQQYVFCASELIDTLNLLVSRQNLRKLHINNRRMHTCINADSYSGISSNMSPILLSILQLQYNTQ